MKKILITGAKSYIGTSFEKYLKEEFPNDYMVDTVDMIDGTWKEKSFCGYDVVFHVAGIAHQKETKANTQHYYKINRDLAIEVAEKAKSDHVKQFVFLSSMSVYGLDVGIITKKTTPKPKTNYGKSKLQAEEKIRGLETDDYKVCVLRSPMVYGDGCKGNYQTIVKTVKKLPFFPKVKNRRSLINIDNLVSFIKMSVDLRLSGLYFPQDKEYVSTMDLARRIASKLGKRIYFSVICGIVVSILKIFSSKFRKAFGSLIYKDTEDFDFIYCEEGRCAENKG